MMFGIYQSDNGQETPVQKCDKARVECRKTNRSLQKISYSLVHAESLPSQGMQISDQKIYNIKTLIITTLITCIWNNILCGVFS